MLERVSRTDATVLIRGESGAGKELVARAVHDLSRRAKGPFRAINCATLTGELLASELFGHVKGAFTGALRDRRGLFALADKGTIFLDEVAELPLDLQARLLRVLQERTFVPLGGAECVSVDVRLVSATNKALRQEVEAGRFREDLMYRVRVVTLFIPRLAEREGDVEALTWHFIDEFNQGGFRHVKAVEAAAMEALMEYRWPGNVRELRNNIEHAFAIGEGDTLTLDELSPELRSEPPRAAPGEQKTVRDMERDRIVEALKATRGRKGEAADLLEMSRSTLWRKMREYHLI
jgi:transcriptional regulator with PAS, ATPase and Fis domain